MAKLLVFTIVIVGMAISSTDAVTCSGTQATLCTSSSASSYCQAACSAVLPSQTAGQTFTACCVPNGSSFLCMCCNLSYQTTIGMPSPVTYACPSSYSSTNCPCDCYTPQVMTTTCTSTGTTGSRYANGTFTDEDVQKFTHSLLYGAK